MAVWGLLLTIIGLASLVFGEGDTRHARQNSVPNRTNITFDHILQLKRELDINYCGDILRILGQRDDKRDTEDVLAEDEEVVTKRQSLSQQMIKELFFRYYSSLYRQRIACSRAIILLGLTLSTLPPPSTTVITTATPTNVTTTATPTNVTTTATPTNVTTTATPTNVTTTATPINITTTATPTNTTG